MGMTSESPINSPVLHSVQNLNHVIYLTVLGIAVDSARDNSGFVMASISVIDTKAPGIVINSHLDRVVTGL